MKSILIIAILAFVMIGVNGFATGEEQKSLLRPPQFEQPALGRTVDVSFKVVLEGIPEGAACVSVMQEQAIILIHRDILEYLKIAQPAASKTQEDRLSRLYGRRAEALLKNAMTIKDDFGCLVVETPFDDDARYLISELLKSGQAGAIDIASGKPVDHIYVRYKAFMAGPLAGKGDIEFSFAERSEAFLRLLWWIS